MQTDFGSINRGILMKKLHANCIPDVIVNFRIYISNRMYGLNEAFIFLAGVMQAHRDTLAPYLCIIVMTRSSVLITSMILLSYLAQWTLS